MRGEFRDADVAKAYRFRPPYPPRLYDFITGLATRHDRLLDIGCGTGKLAIPLAECFSEIAAIDPSSAMIQEGKLLDASRHSNIEWIKAGLEGFETEKGFDIATAGNSIHWLSHEIVFHKLKKWTDVIAVITGDEPDPPPCGRGKWEKFLTRWLEIMAKKTPGTRHRYNAAALEAEAHSFESWIEIEGCRKFRFVFNQRVDDFIKGQHSRATWSRRSMGHELATLFDAELRDLLHPYEVNGILDMVVEPEVTWGKPGKRRKR